MKTAEKVAGSIGKGLVAGFAGTAAMTISSTLEARLRGRAPSSAPARATAKVLGISAFEDGVAQARFNDLSHWGYGTGWGVVRGLLDAAGLPPRKATAAHGAAVWGSAQVTLPALDVAPPAIFWPKEEIAIDAFHHTVYAVATGHRVRAAQLTQRSLMPSSRERPPGSGPACLRLLAGGVFVVFGIGKFVNHASELASFKTYGLPAPDAFVIVIGLVEVVGGLLLIAGVLTRPAALVLAGDMVGAIVVSGIKYRNQPFAHRRPDRVCFVLAVEKAAHPTPDSFISPGLRLSLEAAAAHSPRDAVLSEVPSWLGIPGPSRHDRVPPARAELPSTSPLRGRARSPIGAGLFVSGRSSPSVGGRRLGGIDHGPRRWRVQAGGAERPAEAARATAAEARRRPRKSSGVRGRRERAGSLAAPDEQDRGGGRFRDRAPGLPQALLAPALGQPDQEQVGSGGRRDDPGPPGLSHRCGRGHAGELLSEQRRVGQHVPGMLALRGLAAGPEQLERGAGRRAQPRCELERGPVVLGPAERDDHARPGCGRHRLPLAGHQHGHVARRLPEDLADVAPGDAVSKQRAPAVQQHQVDLVATRKPHQVAPRVAGGDGHGARRDPLVEQPEPSPLDVI